MKYLVKFVLDTDHEHPEVMIDDVLKMGIKAYQKEEDICNELPSQITFKDLYVKAQHGH